MQAHVRAASLYKGIQKRRGYLSTNHEYDQDRTGMSSTGDPRNSRSWKPSKEDDQYFWNGAKSKTRSVDEDWFEERLTQKGRLHSPKAPARKAGWNQWISPDLQSTTQNSGVKKSSGPAAGKTSQMSERQNGRPQNLHDRRESDSERGGINTSFERNNDIGRRSSANDDRRNFPKAQSSSDMRRMSGENHAEPHPWPQALLREEDTTMIDTSNCRQQSESYRSNEGSNGTKGMVLINLVVKMKYRCFHGANCGQTLDRSHHESHRVWILDVSVALIQDHIQCLHVVMEAPTVQPKLIHGNMLGGTVKAVPCDVQAVKYRTRP